jgi:hypothetical protein
MGICIREGTPPMDHLHYRLNFDLNKSRQKFHTCLPLEERIKYFKNWI